MKNDKSLAYYHQLLKGDEWSQDFSDWNTDQRQNKPRPDVQKPCPPDAQTFDLIPPEDFTVGQTPTIDVIRARCHRAELHGIPVLNW